MKARAPQLVENDKKILVVKGSKTSQIINDALKDITALTKPLSKAYTRNNDLLPFEDPSSLEYFCTKNDCSLIAFGNHNKKRPHNLILGRLFDGNILDMYEFGIDQCASMMEVLNASDDHRTKGVGSKPMMVFLGTEWES